MHSDIWCTCTLHALHVYLAVVRNDFKKRHLACCAGTQGQSDGNQELLIAVAN